MTDLMRLQNALEAASGAMLALFAWQTTPNDRDEWGTITVDGQATAVWGDGRMQEQALAGSVHLFCRRLDSQAPAGIQAGFQRLGISWRLDDVIYETDTRLLHYVWTWEEWGGLNA